MNTTSLSKEQKFETADEALSVLRGLLQEYAKIPWRHGDAIVKIGELIQKLLTGTFDGNLAAVANEINQISAMAGESSSRQSPLEAKSYTMEDIFAFFDQYEAQQKKKARIAELRAQGCSDYEIIAKTDGKKLVELFKTNRAEFDRLQQDHVNHYKV